MTFKLNSYYRVIKSPCFPTNFPNQQTLPQPMTSQHACWNKNIWSSSKIHRPLRWADHCTFFLQIFHLAWSSNYIFDPNLTMLWNEKHPRCNWVVYNLLQCTQVILTMCYSGRSKGFCPQNRNYLVVYVTSLIVMFLFYLSLYCKWIFMTTWKLSTKCSI